jgi:hypothetical protein
VRFNSRAYSSEICCASQRKPPFLDVSHFLKAGALYERRVSLRAIKLSDSAEADLPDLFQGSNSSSDKKGLPVDRIKDQWKVERIQEKETHGYMPSIIRAGHYLKRPINNPLKREAALSSPAAP